MASIQQPSAVQLGEYGEDQAAAFFSGVGWGPLKTNKHDLGTDLFVQLRNDDLTDLRMLLGAQVKTGDSWFAEPGALDHRDGWWFRESDKKHAEYWTNHHVPHILVLQSTDMSTRVWAVLDSQTIVDTGAGIKVFVPREQSLEATWKPRWIELVAEARKLLSFEGARWTFSITQVPEEAWARYALIVPRLVIPHQNKGYSLDINWAEAVAVCIDGDPSRWERFAIQRPDVPNTSEAFTHSDPGWRLASAISGWVVGDATGLESVQATDFPRYLAVARAICSSIAATDHYDLDRAAALLVSEIVENELSADQVWLAVHLAHIRRLQGDLESARAILENGLAASAGLSTDLTTSALRAACVLGLFELAPMLSGDVGSAVTAADNSASWWRRNSVAAGLETDAKKRFNKWARDRSIVIGGVDSAHNNLFSAALTARLAADFGGWRGYTSLLVQTDLVTPPHDLTDVANSLDSFRQTGDKKSLKLAVRKVREDGPLGALAHLAALASPEHATSLSIHADLELLAESGDYFSEAASRQWIDLLLVSLDAPDAFYARYAVTHWAFHEMVSAIAGLRRHLTQEDQIAIIEFAKSLPDDVSELLEAPLSRLLHDLDPTVLDEHLASYDCDIAPSGWLGKLFRDVLAPRSPRARGVVRAALLQGDLSALSGASDVTRIAADEASVLLDICDAGFEQNRRPSNGITMGGQDLYRLGTILALSGPEAMRPRAWRAVTAAVVETIDVPERKYAAIKLIAGHAGLVPPEFRAQLVFASRELRTASPSRFADRSIGLKPVGSLFTELVLELDPNAPDWGDLLTSLLAGDGEARRGACDVLARRPGHEVTLLALTHDAEQQVAVRAARGLAQRVACEPNLPFAFASELVRRAEEAGESLPFAILLGVSEVEELTTGGVALLGSLLEHASTRIRHESAGLMAERGWQYP